MVKNGVKEYFENFWNIIDLLPLFTATLTMVLYIEEFYTRIDSPTVVDAESDDSRIRLLKGGAGSIDGSLSNEETLLS